MRALEICEKCPEHRFGLGKISGNYNNKYHRCMISFDKLSGSTKDWFEIMVLPKKCKYKFEQMVINQDED